MTDQSIQTCHQFRLLIAGSRHASPAMLATANQAVMRAKANGWCVLVGDAEGIDTAVIVACNQQQVNYICFGIAAKPRSKAFSSVRDGGTGRYIRVASKKPYDYATRDRHMADLADRGVFLWTGESKGTKKAYDYMQSLNKPVDLLTFGMKRQTPFLPQESQTTRQQPPQPATVEVIIDTTQHTDVVAGVFGLRALDSKGSVLYQKRVSVSLINESTVDYARLVTLIQALECLKKNLKGDSAAYAIRVLQTSKNVEGWLHHGWKRNAPRVQQLTSAVDDILKHFPVTEWIKMPRPQVTSILTKIS
ncbi:MAG: hypothetical protein IT324_06835 [Anaerolineae bacterium]|nr:hypothetical protein [Anaerolineae bacterium]